MNSETIDNSAGVHLIPAGSSADNQRLERFVRGSGIKLSTLRNDIEERIITNSSDSEAVTTKLEDLEKREADLLTEKEEVKEQIQTTKETHQSRVETEGESVYYDDGTSYRETDSTGGHLDDRTTQRGHLEEFHQQKDEIQDELEAVVDALKSKRELDAFIDVANIDPSTHDAGVQCWPISQNLWENSVFRAGDLILFYQGNYRYSQIATVQGAVRAPTLVDVLPPKDDDLSETGEILLILEDSWRVDISSNVIASYAEDDLDYPTKHSQLDTQARTEIVQDYDTLSKFVQNARTGIASKRSPSSESEVSKEEIINKNQQPLQLVHAEDQQQAESATSEEDTVQANSTSGVQIDSVADDKSRDDRTTTVDPATTISPSKTNETRSQSATEPHSSGHSTDIAGDDDTEQPDAEATDTSRFTEQRRLQKTAKKEKLVVLSGPRGTAKKHAVVSMAREWFSNNGRIPLEDRIKVVNLHEGMTYEEFVLGERNSDDDAETLVTGHFGQFCDLAAADTQQASGSQKDELPRYIMIIEDFHTVEPAEVFGNLWQRLSHSNRGKENAISLIGSRTQLWIPENLFVIGLVDTNQPETQLSATTRKKFTIRQTTPAYEMLRDLYSLGELDISDVTDNDTFAAQSIAALKTLNTLIAKSEKLGPNYQFGERYLCDSIKQPEPLDETALHDAWQYDILADFESYFDKGIGDSYKEILPSQITSKLDLKRTGRLRQDSAAIKSLISELSRYSPD